MYSIDLLLGYAPEDALLKSIIDDIANLFGTRPQCRFFHKGETSILDYGLPDLSYYSTYSTEDQRSVCKLVAKALERFEPRLSKVLVVPASSDSDERFHFHITANVALGQEYVTIALDLGSSSEGITLSRK